MGKKGMGTDEAGNIYTSALFLESDFIPTTSWTLRINLKGDPVIIPIPRMRKLSLQKVR